MDSAISEFRVRQAELNERLASLCGRDVVTKGDVEAATSKCISGALMRETLLRSDLESLTLQHEAAVRRGDRCRQAEEALAAAQKQAAELEDAKRVLLKDAALAAERVQAAEGQVVLLTTSLAEVQNNATELQRQTKFLEKQLQTADAERREWQQRAVYEASSAQVAQQELAGGRDSTQHYLNEITRWETAGRDAEKALLEERAALAKAHEAVDTLKARVAFLENPANDKQLARADALQAEVDAGRARMTELSQICETEHASNVTLGERAVRLQASLEEEREERAAEHAALAARVAALEAAKEALEAQVLALTEENGVLTERCAKGAADLDTAKLAARTEKMTLKEHAKTELEAAMLEKDAAELRAKQECDLLRGELERSAAEVEQLAVELADKELKLAAVDTKKTARQVAQLEAERDSLKHELMLNLESRRQLTEAHGKHLAEAAAEIRDLREVSEAKASRFEDFEATIKALRCQLQQEQIVVEKLSDRLIVASEAEKEAAALKIRLEESETKHATLTKAFVDTEHLSAAAHELTLSRGVVQDETFTACSAVLTGVREVERCCAGIDEALANHSAFVKTVWALVADLDTIGTMLPPGKKAPASVLNAAKARCRHALNHHLTESEKRFLGAAPGKNGIEFSTAPTPPSTRVGGVAAAGASAKQLKQLLTKLAKGCDLLDERVRAAKASAASARRAGKGAAPAKKPH
eukprot:TRINITY_DN961_c0_g1_i1.p1 TRINITY_DN961_c0_g1~~TRINITY_DN961_c0_g1_i1.p1  ORF type:complete len:706 (+),score=363.10 TRINITY_DN961_c0_g1_i1:82-2199(+)